jgi:purine-nucleoside phosphorylase
MNDDIERCLEEIGRRAPGFVPQVGLVLGSGLSDVADEIASPRAIDYATLPGFPAAGVTGHAGRLVLGNVGGVGVAVLQGREHFYEHGRADAMKVAVRVLARLGCRTMILTNSAGSLRPEMTPGAVMAITDHINFVGASPLFGERGDSRFIDMSDAYDPDLRARLNAVARSADITLHEGVYIWFAGPSFETPAEIRAAGRLGADAVGMSTVPEVVLARHAGMKVAALSLITNMAAGLGSEPLTHAQTIASARSGGQAMRRLLCDFIASLC